VKVTLQEFKSVAQFLDFNPFREVIEPPTHLAAQFLDTSRHRQT
jgi:hypothetical protein